MTRSADMPPAPNPDVHLGQKRLTLENWLSPDKLMQLIVTIDHETGHLVPETANSWAHSVLEPQLRPSVPEDIRRMFEVARGTMLYGFFFYPTLTLATEQLDRIVDAALAHRLPHLKKKRFADRIAAAVDAGVIPLEERIRWDARRHLRNYAAHAVDQTIFSPSDALRALDIAVEQINARFPADIRAPD